MNAYLPVVIGETHDMRSGVEALLSPYDGDVAKRLEELDTATRHAGNEVSFGAELEFQFVDDPAAKHSSDRSPDLMYEDVVMAVLQSNEIAQPLWPKGAIVLVGENPNAIMLTEEPSDQGGDIIEIRTAPAYALEAIEHYWQVVHAIGRVAQTHGKMGLILSTHINAAVGTGNKLFPFVDYGIKEGGKVLASIQHNLQAVTPLQLDAGLETGASVQEAYPVTKDATTTVYHERLELRHPLVGIADPRIDMLAVLAGVQAYQLGNVPTAAFQQLRQSDVYMWTTPSIPFRQFLNSGIVVDNTRSSLTLPGLFDLAARNQEQHQQYDAFGQLVTGDNTYSHQQDDGKAIRAALQHVRVSSAGGHATLVARSKSALSTEFIDSLSQTAGTYLYGAYRTQPHITYDSPEGHALRRRNLLHSATVRRILGQVGSGLTPASEAIALRAELINQTMVVSDAQVE